MRRRRTSEQEALAQEARAFLEGVDRSLPGELAERFAALVDYERRLHAAGLAVVAWPERYGGRGLGPAEAALVSEELGHGHAPETVNFVALEVVAPALLQFASAEQNDRWLPSMPGADEVWCQLFSEPDAGSDLAALRTKAVQDEDVWIVEGQKVWCTWGQFADKGLLLARSGSTESRHRGISAFVVDMHAPGIHVRPLRSMTGQSEFAEVHLDRVRVPGADLVGTVDGGWAVAMAMLAGERGPYAVRRASVVRAALGELHDHVRTRGADRRARLDVVNATMAMFVLDRRIDAVVQHLSTDGAVPGGEAAITKSLLTRAEQAVFAGCHGALGMAGTAAELLHPWVEHYLYSRAASIYGGTVQIQRTTIGERVLGLPRGG